MMNNKIGQTIWGQITTVTKMSVGARNAIDGGSLIKFQVGSKLKHFVSVELNLARDHYVVKYFKLNRAYTVVPLLSIDGVYVGELNETIYQMVNK